MEVPKIKQKSKEEFIGELFQIRDKIHLAHLSSKSYSEHNALGDFYDSLLSMIDLLAESLQGKYGIMSISIKDSSTESPVELISRFVKTIDGGSSYNIFNESWVKNQLDEIATICYQTIYKLKNLK